MHFCAVIIHHKDDAVIDVRKLAGDCLVERGEADWYSTDNYRERTFDGVRTIPFADFKAKDDLFEKDNPLALFVVEKDAGYLDEILIPSGFWEIYGQPERDEIVKLYNEAFYNETQKVVSEVENVDDMVVTLLDYHN